MTSTQPPESRTPSNPPVRILFWDVDTQVDFMRETGRLHVPDAESLATALARLTAAADRHRIPVVASADDHEMDDPEISLEPDFRTTYPPHCMRGTPGSERIPETRQRWTLEAGHEPLPRGRIDRALEHHPARVLIHKKTVDVFSNPNTGAILEALDPTRVVVYGVALDVCNRMAVEGLLARGRQVVLATDATRPLDSEAAGRLLADWRRRGVEMTTTDALIASLER